MSLIPEAKIQEVRERLDMIALVQRHGVELKKSGRSYKGRCPFHQEKSPSFYVWPEEKRFKCFGCQAGGDAISFVQRLLGKPFVDTVRDALDPALPWSGVKDSGRGLTLSQLAFDTLTRPKAVHLRLTL